MGENSVCYINMVLETVYLLLAKNKLRTINPTYTALSLISVWILQFTVLGPLKNKNISLYNFMVEWNSCITLFYK